MNNQISQIERFNLIYNGKEVLKDKPFSVCMETKFSIQAKEEDRWGFKIELSNNQLLPELKS